MQTQAWLENIKHAQLVSRTGKLSQFYGSVVEANGPDVFVGEVCEIHSNQVNHTINAEVVGLQQGKVLLMPAGDLKGVRLGSQVVATGRTFQVPVGKNFLGRVIDPFGNPLDGKGPIQAEYHAPLYPEPINPLERSRITDVLETGVKAIDSCLTVGKGQRIGLFAGSGVGKSTLLGMLARHCQAGVNVIALIGERGREVRDFIEDTLGEEGLKKSVVVVATADQPALVRTHAAFAATALAEYFRSQDQHVLLMMDSITRLAMAQREIGLSIGEPPTSRGYTPSSFAILPRVLERCGGLRGQGSISAFYTVLVEGDDMNDPVADNVRAIVDGHIVLTREIANRGHYPAIDLQQSVSRLMPDITSDAEYDLAIKTIEVLTTYNSAKDMIDMGLYKQGANPKLDRAIDLMEKIEPFLKQKKEDVQTRTDAIGFLRGVVHKD